jgi:SAM-dependent methyltransferase
MRGKYDQVNEFLKVIDDVLKGEVKGEEPFTVVDCGCGKAYLTLALYFFLTQTLKFPAVRVIGVDRREDVIAAARKMAQQLDAADNVQFVAADLSTFDIRHSTLDPRTSRVDMVISLHACDTATDEALAKGVEWKSRYIVSAPCCQHELQKTLGQTGSDTSAFAGVLRHGILRERLCDILTDSFRAMILRILGFKTQVVEFVSPDATARNILLRAEYGVKPGQGGAISDYLNLRDWWRVTPWLETRLSGILGKYLERYS